MTKENELVITRVFNAPVELVWKMWTDPEHCKKWCGPRGFTTPVCRIDFRVGGKFLNCMKATQEIEGPNIWKKGIWSTGVYKEIIPLEKIVCTDSFADENGNVVHATHYGMNKDFPLEMLVTVTFEEHDGKTKMTLRHMGMPAGADTEGANQGWNQSFDKLAEIMKEESA
jgi:uncharacterized protein YndB with AHSA1/START domain